MPDYDKVSATAGTAIYDDLIHSTSDDSFYRALISGATATSDGVWYEAGERTDCTVHISGATAATVKIHQSNSPTKPANSSAQSTYSTDANPGDKVYYIAGPFRWIKASVSAYTSGTVNVYYMGA